MSTRDPKKYGYATAKEHRAARRRIRSRSRHLFGRMPSAPPPGTTPDGWRQYYRDKRRYLNYTHGKNGSPDVEYKDQGLSYRYMASDADADIEAKMTQARLESEAKRNGKEIGRMIVRQILEGGK